MLALSLVQMALEGTLLATPYGLLFLRSQIVPCLLLILFFGIALQLTRADAPPGQPRLASQVFFLFMILPLTYWAATSPFQHNQWLLLGVWGILPLLYLGGTGAIAPNTLVSLASMLVTLALFEFLLRPFPRLWPTYARQVGSNWRRLHADIPGIAYLEKGVRYRTNALGFRGDGEVPDLVDLVALGDSFTFGVGSEAPWPVLLEGKSGLRVLNLGMGGTNPSKHVAPLVAYGLPRQPELVLEAYFEGNDLYTCYMPPNPLGPRWGDRLVSPDVLGGAIEAARLRFRGAGPTSALSYNIVTPIQREYSGRRVTLTFSPAYSATLTLDRERMLASENWRILSGSLLRMRELAESQSSAFALIYLPERTRVYWPLIREDEEILRTLNRDMIYQWQARLGCLVLEPTRNPGDWQTFREAMDETIDDQFQLLQAFSEQHSIPLLDLTPSLREMAAQGMALADPLETHYNEAANARIAAEIASFLTAEGLVAP